MPDDSSGFVPDKVPDDLSDKAPDADKVPDDPSDEVPDADKATHDSSDKAPGWSSDREPDEATSSMPVVASRQPAQNAGQLCFGMSALRVAMTEIPYGRQFVD